MSEASPNGQVDPAPPIRIAVIPGDGVGPEVTEEALRVLGHVETADQRIEFAIDQFPWGTDHYLKTGAMMPPEALETLADYDAILFGAVGSPLVKDHITLRQLLLPIRFAFDQYVNLRPVRLFPGVPTPLAGVGPEAIDMVFVREGTEGEYAGLGDRAFPNTPREFALQTSVFTRQGCERVIRWAFELARSQHRSLTSVSKGNALQYSAVLWDEVFEEVSQQYPEIETRSLLVDAAAYLMVKHPERFEIVVASNLFADILTDLGAALMGGLGFAASASLNPDRAFPSTFEPVHGSAPDIAGTGSANPIGAIWSTALMLEHLGFPEWRELIVGALESVLAGGRVRPIDMGGDTKTADVGTAILAHMPATLASRTLTPDGPEA